MKNLLVPIAVAALAASMSPAAAQSWSGQRDYGQSYQQGQSYRDGGQAYGARGQYRDQGQAYRGGGQGRLTTAYVDGLDWRIANAAQERRISWGEARQLRSDVRAVHDMVWRIETGQARAWEVNRVQQVVSRVEMAVGGVNDRGGYGRRR